MSSLVCVPITVHDPERALVDAERAKLRGASLVELRLDGWVTGSGEPAELRAALRLCRESALPCIATCRPSWEGGFYEGQEAARIDLLEALAASDHPPRYIDLELGAAEHAGRIACHPGTSLIVSMHDFASRPTDLTRRVRAMQEVPGARVLKVAYRARSIRDNLELFDLLADRDRPMIALGMGEFGLMSRVLSPKFGGLLTFASLDAQTATAPGQPTISELLDVYRFGSIGASTRVYGVVGWPVAHSLGPLVHNAGFEAIGHDGVYLPLPAAADRDDPLGSRASFTATVGSLIDHRSLGFAGASVTIPHKEHLAQLGIDAHGSGDIRVSRSVRRCGAANTLVGPGGAPSVAEPDDAALVDDGRWAITNTDAPAIADLLEQRLNSLSGMRIGVVGAGGVARAAAFELVERGAEVEIYNRSQDRARSLADELGQTSFSSVAARATAHELSDLPASTCAAYINASPVGMAGGPRPDAIAVPVGEMRSAGPETVVFDTVYTPVETPLICAARDRGCRVIDGVELFVRQAAAQFELWTGNAAPVGLFDRLCRESLDQDAWEAR